ncbi:hypothetical protein HK405_009872 [Cladochytrium tenue]|nr:hypothetical protein HK405_009872 [Cladochytrium tenue]
MTALTNLLSNPSFSDFASLCMSSYCSGNEVPISPWFLTEWVAGNPYYELDLAGYLTTYGGAIACMDLNNIYPYTIGQWATTTPGNGYMLQYYVSSNENCDYMGTQYLVKTGFVRVNGSDAQNFTYNDETDSGYLGFTFNFTATVDQTLVEIGSSFQQTRCGPVAGFVGLYEISAPKTATVTVAKTATTTETETLTDTATVTTTATNTTTLTAIETDLETLTETLVDTATLTVDETETATVTYRATETVDGSTVTVTQTATVTLTECNGGASTTVTVTETEKVSKAVTILVGASPVVARDQNIPHSG